MKREIIHNVQALRFVAASAVAVSHIAALLVPYPAQSGFWSVPWTAGVDLFFVISGFIMVRLTDERFGAPGAAADFLKRRIIRIVPPYWFFTTLTIAAVLILGGRVGGTTVDFPQTVTSFGFIPWPRADGQLNPIVSQGWTLNYEAFFYLAFTLALLARRGLIVLCAAFLAFALVHPLIPAWLFVLKFWSNPIILDFLGGIVLAKIYLSGRRLPLWGSIACAALAVIAFIAMSYSDFGFLSRFAERGIPAILLAASLILAREPKRLGAVRRLVQRGGDASYTIYLAHYMIINMFVLLWKRTGIGWPWAGVAAGMVVAIGASMIFYQLVERPITNALQRRYGRPRAAALDTVAP
jgi:peptidoglycan/LPS O-acetylase OafA/YrhL